LAGYPAGRISGKISIQCIPIENRGIQREICWEQEDTERESDKLRLGPEKEICWE
jgi:hypothetical protein